MNRVLGCSILLLGLAGCERFRKEDPEREARRQAAARNACIHAELATNGRTALRQMQQMMGASESGPAVAVQQYARAYSDYAELRALTAAFLDSAVNHADGRQDSVRYVQQASRHVTSPPEPGTLEANIARAHAHDLRVIAADTAHACNQPSS